jgi:hypothetical protein
MKIITVLFDRPGGADYERLYNAFIRSVAESMSGVPVETLKIGDLPIGQREPWANNLAKMRAWRDIVIDQPTLLLDCDLIVQHSLEPLAQLGAGLVLTTGGASPFNAGVVVIGPGMQGFLGEWIDKTEEMYADKQLRDKYIGKYRGISQSALGWMLDHHRDNYQIAAVPARDWNARLGDWEHVTDDTRVIHYKGDLRSMVLGQMAPNKRYTKAIEIWRRYDGP